MLAQIRGHISFVLVLTCHVLEAIALVGNATFRVARFSGNESASVLAYSAGTTVVPGTVTLFICGALCVIGKLIDETAFFF
jgi:hypothetical protein